MRNLWKLRYFLKPYKTLFFVVLLLSGAGVLLDLLMPRLTAHIIDFGISAGNKYVIHSTAAAMFILAVIEAAITIVRLTLGIRLSEKTGSDIRVKIFSAAVHLPLIHSRKIGTGALITRLAGDTMAVQRAVEVISFFTIRALTLFIGSTVLMCMTNLRLALKVLPFLIFIAVIIPAAAKKLSGMYFVIRGLLDRINVILQESLAGIRIIKVFVRHRFEIQRFQSANRNYLEHSLKVLYTLAFIMPLVETILLFSNTVILLSGGLSAIRGTMTVGNMVAFSNYLLIAARPIIMTAMMVTILSSAAAAARRIDEILALEKTNSASFDGFVSGIPRKTAVPFIESVDLHLHSVSFSFGGEPVISCIHLDIPAGSHIVLTGPTGSGKTTLLFLTAGLYTPSAGTVTAGYGGKSVIPDCAKWNTALMTQKERSRIFAFVPQETELFSGTIMENICFGMPGAPAEEVQSAAEIACIHDFIRSLPSGYNTHVLQHGVNLSGGQKQRIAIARALLVKPCVLILDDAVSAVDQDTEKKILENIGNACGKITVLRVTQRLRSASESSTVLLLENGKISAMGSHTGLLRTSEVYREMYESQEKTV